MAGDHDRLDRAELLHERLIAGYLDAGFFERAWLAERVERHLRDPECRFLLLTGGPGTGKSAFLAWLARLHPVAPRYFLRRSSNHPLASGDAWSLLLSIGHQLAVLRPEIMSLDLDVEVTQDVGRVAAGGEVVGVRVGEVWVTPFQHTAFQVTQQINDVEGRVVAFEINRLIADARLNNLGNLQSLALLEPAVRLAERDSESLVVVLIDAVDELRYQWSAVGGRGDILEWLAECPELPPNVRIVVTSRPDDKLEQFRERQSDRLREIVIDPAGPEVQGDLLAYTVTLLAETVVASVFRAPPGLARRVAARAGGSFLYVVLWGKALREAAQTGDSARIAAVTDMSALPAGLDGIHRYFLVLVRDSVRRQEPRWRQLWRNAYRPLLAVLAVAQTPLTFRQILRLGDLHDHRDEVADALKELTQFVYWEGLAVQLYHTSLAEFLTSADESRVLDDWHVEADESHYEVAALLIVEHGGSWENCEDEYALAHVVTHLVAAIRVANSASLRNKATELLIGLLGDPGFGVGRALRAGTDTMLDDYVAAHEALRPASPGLIHTLASTLAEVLARLAGRGVRDVADTTHAVVGVRIDADELNETILSRLSDPAYLERFVADETDRSLTLIAFSHAQATRLRRKGDPASLEEARALLLRAAAAAKDFDGRTTTRLRSSLFYDLGYLDFLHGDHDRALDSLERSRAAAEEGGDRTGAYISRLVGLRVGLLSGAVSPEDYRTALEEALVYFTSDEARGPHAARWAMTVHGQLLDLALTLEDAELAATELQAMEDAPWIRQAGRTDIVTKYRARVAAVVGDRAEACTLFGTLLRDELTGEPSHREELSRDLFYYGRALADVGDIAEARQVWDRGLRCPDNAANWPWKPKIAALLDN
ncbi:hypothetical protein [Amycolatopsis sp.]|uniref:hypothetical protein n=1 Tax=Amycolatopsis sp. TaxID=37632 RepID=UPI002DF7E069|nr:hypothetical protein [Amycolatopsis sp.]